MEKNWNLFMASFRRKRIGKSVFYELIFIAVTITVALLLTKYFAYLANEAISLNPVGIDYQLASESDLANLAGVVKLQLASVLSGTLGILLIVVAYITTRFYVYGRLTDTKLKRGLYGRYLMTSLFVIAVSGLLIYIIQFILFLIFGPGLEKIFNRLAIYLLFSVGLAIVAYLSMNFNIQFFTKKGFIKGSKAFWKQNILGVKQFLIPIGYSFVVFILLNIIVFFISFSPSKTLFLVVGTLGWILYLAWLRSYYLDCQRADKKRSLKKIKKRKK